MSGSGTSGVRRFRQLAAWPAAGTLVLGLTVTGCGGTDGGSGLAADANLAGTAAADGFNDATVQSGGKVTWAIGKTVENWNLLSADGNTFDSGQVLNGIYPYTFIANPSYSVAMNPDLLESAAQTGTSPQTVVYRIKQDAVWSDGVPIDADDFVYAWQVQNGADANIPNATSIGYDQIQSVTGSDGGKTVTVVFKTPFADWKSLFGPLYPAHVARQHGSDEASFTWFGANPPTVSGGPFTVSSVSSDRSSVTLSRNAKYYGPAARLDQVVFRSITDSTQEPAALRNREVDGIYPQPQADLVNQVKSMGGAVTYHIDSGLQFEHFDFNLKNPVLGDKTWGKTLRTAMFTAVDRTDMLSKTIWQFQPTATTLDNRMFVHNQARYQDNLAKYGLGSGDAAKARKLLTDAGFKNAATGGRLTAPDGATIPAFSLKYTAGDEIRQDESDLFAADMAKLGITVDVSPTDNLGATLSQSGTNYTYDIVVFAWVATPFPASANQPLYVTGGGSNYGGYSNPEVDRWLNAAATATDPAAITTDLNKADDQISQDAYTLPLYQKPTLIAFDPKLGNVRDNSTQIGPTYDIQQWGLKASGS
ncbi:MAG TPA: ABC transporter family substrate-binding protein [Actinocrinis sp.]|uniref:ABC transporter family substrate-binding protein n=1 Tax=Actinocrinis sp. TaxID=1920516 RepID=UPI002DDD37C0|nr:ABC transporter family substrate-binding protein [Actinocrinis sp.]HEV2347420.1 ABC transporter family substrate-binding protein [Actinocrinis sp.]